MSKRNVSPAARGAAEVRPKRPSKRAQRDAKPENTPAAPPAGGAEHATPSPSAGSADSCVTPPFFYERAFKRLRADVLFASVDLSNADEFKRVADCKGYDFLAGELVAQAVKAERLDAWGYVPLLQKLVERVAKDHDNDAEREQALLLLGAARNAHGRVLMEDLEAADACMEALEALAESAEEVDGHWAQVPVVRLGLDVIYALQYAATGWKTKHPTRPSTDLITTLDCNVRELLRAVRAYGGHALMLTVYERLKGEMKALGEAAP